MTLSPEDINAQQFSVVLRGYKVEEVDSFLDAVRRDLAERAEAAAQQPKAREPSSAAPAPGDGEDAGVADGSNALSARALRTLGLAQEMADKITSSAAAEAEQVIAEAHEQAEAVVAEARAEAGAVHAELQVRRRQELESLEARAAQLRAETDRLEQLERHCRDSLQRWLAQQQLLVDPAGGAVDGRSPDGRYRPLNHSAATG